MKGAVSSACAKHSAWAASAIGFKMSLLNLTIGLSQYLTNNHTDITHEAVFQPDSNQPPPGMAFGFVVVSGLVGSLVSRSVLHEVSGTT